MDSLLYSLQVIVAIFNRRYMPSIGLEAFQDIFSKRDIDLTIDRNIVSVVKSNNFTKFPMSMRDDPISTAENPSHRISYPAREMASAATPS